jgi:hypothetical protein
MFVLSVTCSTNPRSAIARSPRIDWWLMVIAIPADRPLFRRSTKSGAPLDLAVEPLEAVGGADAVPVLLREGVELGGRLEAIGEARHRLRELAPEAGGELHHPPARLRLARRQEYLADRLGEPRPELLGGLPDDVPLKMHAAPLQRRLGQVVTYRLGETGVGVGDHELHYGVSLAEVDTPRVVKPGEDRVEGQS